MNLDRHARRSLLLLGAWMVSYVFVFWLVYEVTVRTTYGRLFADASLRGAVLTQARTEGLVDKALGIITVASLAAAVAVIATIALLRLRRGPGLAAIGVLVAANLSAQVLKGLLERPDLGLRESAPATLNSLPGGHSTAAFSVGVALMLVVPPKTRNAVATGAGVYACVVALATMAAGWHRPADSVTAFLLVGFWAGIAIVAQAVFARDDLEERGPEGPPRWFLRPQLKAPFALGLLALMLVTPLVVATPVRQSGVGQALAFATGAIVMVGTAVVVLMLLLELIDRVAPREAEPRRSRSDSRPQ
ncbi:MAG: phosphatase PAP2 family protein [Marmoricola sp.]